MKLQINGSVLLLILILGTITPLFAIVPETSRQDSVIVTFGDKTRLVIYGENRKELEKILKYDLNALLRDVKLRLDSTGRDTTYIREQVDGSRYLKDVEEGDKNYVRIGMRGVSVKDRETRVRVSEESVEVKEGNDDDDADDSTYRRIGKRFSKSNWGASPRKGFNISLGLNTYGANDVTPGYNKADYDLKPFGSRYVSLGYIVSGTVIKGQEARLHFDLGVDFSWYNLMFDGNNTIAKNDQRIEFIPVTSDSGQVINVRKTKLVVPYVNLSFMPTVSFRRSIISHISAGVYGGYRLGSYTKVRPEGTKDVNRVRQNFYLEDLRYGFSAELGMRNFPDLFVSYDLNKLYEAEKGPSVRMLSFGLRLF